MLIGEETSGNIGEATPTSQNYTRLGLRRSAAETNSETIWKTTYGVIQSMDWGHILSERAHATRGKRENEKISQKTIGLGLLIGLQANTSILTDEGKF